MNHYHAKKIRPPRPTAITLAALLTLITAHALFAEPTNPTAPKTPAAAPSPEPPALIVQPPFIAPPLPQSTFTVPKKREDGLRDPFFPKSNRPFVDSTAPTKTTKATPVAELYLKGISGTDTEPLAIINDVTFAPGEELDVPTKAGKMRIRCVEIKKTEGTALVQVGGERRQLRLAPLK